MECSDKTTKFHCRQVTVYNKSYKIQSIFFPGKQLLEVWSIVFFNESISWSHVVTIINNLFLIVALYAKQYIHAVFDIE